MQNGWNEWLWNYFRNKSVSVLKFIPNFNGKLQKETDIFPISIQSNSIQTHIFFQQWPPWMWIIRNELHKEWFPKFIEIDSFHANGRTAEYKSNTDWIKSQCNWIWFDDAVVAFYCNIQPRRSHNRRCEMLCWYCIQ